MRSTGILSAAFAGVLVGVVAAWIDPTGRTILSDDSEPPVEGAVRLDPSELPTLWEGRRLEEGAGGARPSSPSEGIVEREVRTALDDLERGDPGGALGVVRRLHQAYPNRADLALALAEAERRRGRLEPARQILADLLATPLALQEPFESEARRALKELGEEIEVASLDGDGIQRSVETSHFRLTYDHRLAGRAYGEEVARQIEGIRGRLSKTLGRTLSRKLEVQLYTRRQYVDAHQHRFGFSTVGFFDGVIHVVAGRHPRSELEALLTHEYAHALFEDALGGHRPFFLNEGVAEREEERVRGRTGLVRAQWWKLLEAIRMGTWIPLPRLVDGFGGLEETRAALAYLESRAAVELLEGRDPRAISRWLQRCAAGEPWQRALVAETGWDVAGLDGALREDVRARFPEITLRAAISPQSSGAQ
jgi:hypothetical protein